MVLFAWALQALCYFSHLGVPANVSRLLFFVFPMILISVTTFCYIGRLLKSRLFMGNKSPLLSGSLLFIISWMVVPPPPQLLICHVSSFFSVSPSNQKKMFCVPKGSPVNIERLPFDLACVMMHHTNDGL